MTIEKELLQAMNLLSHGKEEGFNTFYSCTYNYVYSRAKLIMKNEEDALDLTQETFIQAYKGINSLEDANNVYAWLGSIVYRQGMRIFRKKKELLVNDEGEGIFEDVVSQDISGNPEDAAQQKATSEIVMGMIEELPELQKAAILAFYYDNMKIDDIAGIFECSANTIKSRLNYAKKTLKDKVEAHEKANRYKLCSLSPAVLLLACKSLFSTDGYTMAKASAQTVYNASCGAVGLSAGTLALSGAGAAVTGATATAATTAVSAGTAVTTGVAGGAVQAGAAIAAKAGLTLGAKLGIGIASLLTITTVAIGAVHYTNHIQEEKASSNTEKNVEDDSEDASSAGSILDLFQGKEETPESLEESPGDISYEADASEKAKEEEVAEPAYAYGWEKLNGEYVYYTRAGDSPLLHHLVISNVKSASENYSDVSLDLALTIYEGSANGEETLQASGIGVSQYGGIHFDTTSASGLNRGVQLSSLADGSFVLSIDIEDENGTATLGSEGGPIILTKAAARDSYNPALRIQEGEYQATNGDWAYSDGGYALNISNLKDTEYGQSFIPMLNITSESGTYMHWIIPMTGESSTTSLNANMCTYLGETVTDDYSERCEFVVYFYFLEDGSINLYYETGHTTANIEWEGEFPAYTEEPIHLVKVR